MNSFFYICFPFFSLYYYYRSTIFIFPLSDINMSTFEVLQESLLIRKCYQKALSLTADQRTVVSEFSFQRAFDLNQCAVHCTNGWDFWMKLDGTVQEMLHFKLASKTNTTSTEGTDTTNYTQQELDLLTMQRQAETFAVSKDRFVIGFVHQTGKAMFTTSDRKVYQFNEPITLCLPPPSPPPPAFQPSSPFFFSSRLRIVLSCLAILCVGMALGVNMVKISCWNGH